MFPYNFNNQILLNINGVSINTDNIYIAAEILADAYIPFFIVNGTIVFPSYIAPAPAAIVKTSSLVIETVAVAPKMETAETPKPKAVLPQIPKKEPVFALIGANVTLRTAAELKRFLVANSMNLSVSKFQYYTDVLKMIQSEITKPAPERCKMWDLELRVLGVDDASKKWIDVKLVKKELAKNVTGLYLEFSSPVFCDEKQKEVSMRRLENTLHTKAISKKEKEQNHYAMIYAEGSRAKWEQMIN